MVSDGRIRTTTSSSGGEPRVAVAGAVVGLMLGALVGLIVAGDQLFLPVLHTSLGTVAGASLAVVLQHARHARRPSRREARPVDPERWERRVAAHRAIADLDAN